MNGKYVIALIVLGVLLAGCAAQGGQPTAPQPGVQAPPQVQVKQPVKIGFLGPLTGDVAPLADSMHKAVKLALKQANEQGGVNGQPIELIEEDGQCAPGTATTAGQKLVNVDRVEAIVGGFCSGETIALAPVTQAGHVVQISPSSTNPKISDLGEYVFRVVAHDAVQGKVVVDAIRKKGYTKPAIMYMNNDYGNGWKDVAVARFKEFGVTPVAVEAFEQSSRDVKTQLTKVKAAGADVLISISLSAEAPVVLKQLKEMGMSLPVYVGDGAVDQAVIDNAGGAAEGMIGVKSKPYEGAEAKAFEDAYKAEYGQEIGIYGGEGYDAFNLLVEGLRAGKHGKELNDWLYTVDYTGASGRNHFDKNGDVDKLPELFVVKDGKFVPYTEG